MSTKLFPQDIAEQFIKQYKLFELNQLDSPFFTFEQLQILLGAIANDPNNMVAFFEQTQTLVINQIMTERNNETEVVRALVHFNKVIYHIFIPIMALVGKSKEDILKLAQHNKIHDNPFKNLDFNMPNINEFKE